MKEKFNEILGKAGFAVRQYPMVLLMSLFAAFAMMTYARQKIDYPEQDFVWLRLTLVCCLGISLMFGLKMLSQRIGRQILLEVAGLLFLGLYYFLLPPTEKDFTEIYAFWVFPLYILSHLFVSFIPFLSRKSELTFWQYNKNLFINFFLTAIFIGVLTGGVMLAILAVENLFDFHFDDTAYSQTFFFLAIFGSSFIFLLFNGQGLNYLEKRGDYPVVLKFFTQYILIPLLIIYVVILYFYSGKILLNWELPRGWVSYLVLAYAVVGILALLLVHPLKENQTKSWVRNFSRIFFFTLLPLLVLLFTAIFTRILEYGYTEPRYYVLLLALWLTVVVFYFILRKNGSIKIIPISLFLFGIFALIFPYLNAFSVSKRSQENQFKLILEENKLLSKDGKINFEKTLKLSVAERLEDVFRFHLEHNNGDFVFVFLNDDARREISTPVKNKNFYSAASVFRNSIRNVQDDIATTAINFGSVLINAENNIIPVVGYDYAVNINGFTDTEWTIDGNKFKIIQNQIRDHKLVIVLNGQEKADFSFLIKDLVRKYQRKETEVVLPEITGERDLGSYHIKVFITSITLEGYPNSMSPTLNSGFVLIRKR